MAEDDKDKDKGEGGATVFVRNCPYDATDAELAEAFSAAVGPVRRAWLVGERGAARANRGFGYVTLCAP